MYPVCQVLITIEDMGDTDFVNKIFFGGIGVFGGLNYRRTG